MAQQVPLRGESLAVDPGSTTPGRRSPARGPGELTVDVQRRSSTAEESPRRRHSRTHRTSGRSRGESILVDDAGLRELLQSLEDQNLALASNPKAILQTPVTPAGDAGVQLRRASQQREYTSNDVAWFQTWVRRAGELFGAGPADAGAGGDAAWLDIGRTRAAAQLRATRGTHYGEMFDRVRNGIPASQRPAAWVAMCNTAQPAYAEYLHGFYERVRHDPSPHEKQIRKDVTRTLPSHELFRGADGQERLFRVLKAYSLYDAEVGYCQGLAFVAAALLAAALDEAAAFQVLVDLLSPLRHLAAVPRALQQCHGFRAHHCIVHGLRALYAPDMAGLHALMYMFNRLLGVTMPRLHDHLRDAQVPAHMYVGQWFLTLFSYAFSTSLVARLLDVVFVCGAKATVLTFSLVVLRRAESRLLQVFDFERLVTLLKTGHDAADEGRAGVAGAPYDAAWSAEDVDAVLAETVEMQPLVCGVDVLEQLEKEWYTHRCRLYETEGADLREVLAEQRSAAAARDDLLGQTRREARTLAADLEQLQTRYRIVANGAEVLRAKVGELEGLLGNSAALSGFELLNPVEVEPAESLGASAARERSATAPAPATTRSGWQRLHHSLFGHVLAPDAAAAAPLDAAEERQVRHMAQVLDAVQRQFVDMERELVSSKVRLAELAETRDALGSRASVVLRPFAPPDAPAAPAAGLSSMVSSFIGRRGTVAPTGALGGVAGTLDRVSGGSPPPAVATSSKPLGGPSDSAPPPRPLSQTVSTRGPLPDS